MASTPFAEKTPSWRWYHGAAFYVGIQACSFGLAKLLQLRGGVGEPRPGETLVGNAANNLFYNRFTQPKFAPPDWSFAPVWLINNILCIWGLLRVLNMPPTQPGRTTFIWLQSIVWTAYTIFNALYFGLRSPINGAIDTAIGLAATVASMYVAIARLRDRSVAWSQSTILPWLIIATATSAAVAAWNRDDLYDQGPFLTPDPVWVKDETAQRT